MSNKILKYSFGAIALYLITVRGTSAGRVISSAATGATNVIKGFQGR